MLTRLEEKILQFITRYFAENGRAPTLTEIAHGVALKSKGTVHRYVHALVDKGQLTRSGRGWRSIGLTGQHTRSLTILPLSGEIAADKAITRLEGQEEINFSALLLGADRYVLKVADQSMLEEGILPGDMIIIHKTESADNGDIVLAIVDKEEATLKRLKKHGSRIELTAANSSVASMIYPVERVSIQGVLVGQVRLY